MQFAHLEKICLRNYVNSEAEQAFAFLLLSFVGNKRHKSFVSDGQGKQTETNVGTTGWDRYHTEGGQTWEETEDQDFGGYMDRVGEALLLDDLYGSSNKGRRTISNSRVQWFLGFKFSGQVNS